MVLQKIGIVPLFALLLIPIFSDVFSQEEQFLLERECNIGMFVAYKTDNSKSACVNPDTLRELISRGWAFPHFNQGGRGVDPNSTIDLQETCDRNQIVIQGGYSSYDKIDVLELVDVKETTIDDYPGIVITLHNPTDSKVGSGKVPGISVWIDCLDPTVSNFYECQEASHYTNTKNWPIIECRTLDGKQFFIDETVEMSKNSGIEIYTVNYQSSNSLEFVGKTDRVDKMISFSITAPNGDEISTWTEFAPSEGEFRTTVTTGGPLWKQQDGIYTLTAKQVDVPYYEAFSEFELEDGKIIR